MTDPAQPHYAIALAAGLAALLLQLLLIRATRPLWLLWVRARTAQPPELDRPRVKRSLSRYPGLENRYRFYTGQVSLLSCLPVGAAYIAFINVARLSPNASIVGGLLLGAGFNVILWITRKIAGPFRGPGSASP